MEQSGALIALLVLPKEKPSSIYDFALSQHQWAVMWQSLKGMAFPFLNLINVVVGKKYTHKCALVLITSRGVGAGCQVAIFTVYISLGQDRCGWPYVTFTVVCGIASWPL